MIKDHTTTLIEKKQLTSDIWQFEFQLEEPEELDFKAGQYMLLKIGEAYRQYSISSPSSQNTSFEIIVKLIPHGLASNYLKKLQIGEKVEFKGPAGVFTLQNNQKDKIFLATGTGVAPIKSMIESALNMKRETHNVNIYLFFGLRTRDDVYLLDYFHNISEKHRNFTYRICLSREKDFDDLDKKCFSIGRVNKHVMRFIDQNSKEEKSKSDIHNAYEYYICGSQESVDSLKEFIMSFGVHSENIFFEKFG